MVTEYEIFVKDVEMNRYSFRSDALHQFPQPSLTLPLSFPLQDGTPTSKTFEHVTSEIGAEEAEEVGVEHLLRWDVLKD